MRRIFPVFFVLLLVASCKEKPVSLSGTDAVAYKDFIAAFPDVKLPYKVADTNQLKIADTTQISYTVFTEFVPDTALVSLMGKNVNNSKIRPVGKIVKGDETYIIAEFTINKKVSLATFFFNKKNKWISTLLLLKQDIKDNYLHTVTITSEPTFILGREKYNIDNELFYTRNGYAYNSGSGDFIPVMNDTNEDLKRNNEIINPIDTFPHLHKLSGDYILDKKNYISVRDAGNSKLQFFIHFEKNNGDCTGELKGLMTLRDATHAYYQENGDPCVIDFVFTLNTIKVVEQGNCGNHRGIKCFFNDIYKKKKELKPVVTKQKK